MKAAFLFNINKTVVELCSCVFSPTVFPYFCIVLGLHLKLITFLCGQNYTIADFPDFTKVICCHSCNVYFRFALTIAIYLAKRNIRKKGMLEPYEQVCAHRSICVWMYVLCPCLSNVLLSL